jgi:hypothetical protein
MATAPSAERKARVGVLCNPLCNVNLTTLFCPSFVSSAGSRVCDRNPISSSPSLLRCARYDADAEGADWREVARLVLHLDPLRESDRAQRTFDSHLSRAKWMTDQGYRHLLRDGASG